MHIAELDLESYKQKATHNTHVFNSPLFIELNIQKCDEVFFLTFEDTKIRLFLVLGKIGDKLISPFSAPFGGFDYVSNDIRLSFLDEALLSLKKWAAEKKCKEIFIKLPPLIYNESLLSKQMNSLFRADFQIETTDLNYTINLKKLSEDYSSNIWRNAKKNLNIALSSDLFLSKCDSLESKIESYKIIQENRRLRGFPLRMTWEQVYTTSQIIKSDFFIVTNTNKESIAAAIVFHVTSSIVQVIYWGDLPMYSEYKTMNFLSYSIFKYYKESNIDIVDIGPSTENSLPNFGLCEFKESIGCDINLKFSLKCSI